MKLIAVYNVFDGEELLEGSIKRIKPHVDYIIAVAQTKSYNGISYLNGLKQCKELEIKGLINKVYLFNTNNQFTKRQYCLDKALEHGATYYIGMDCDEYYDSNEFKDAKKEAINLNGSYCKIKTYFGTKNLTIGYDNYYVPFIHPVSSNTKIARSYPVAVDPRRRLPGTAKEVNITMHHYSWVRNNIKLKVNAHNSKSLIIKNGLLKDYYNAKEGLFIKHYGKKLEKVKDEI